MYYYIYTHTIHLYYILMIYYYTQRKETPGFSTHPVSWKPNVVIEEDLLDFVVRKHLRVFFDYAQEPGGSFKTWRKTGNMMTHGAFQWLILFNSG